MDYQIVLQPLDFSALLQLVFTLYAAFIAIDYTRSFTARVINRFYDFSQEIESSVESKLALCRNEEMRNNIDSDEYFKEGEGLCLVEDYRVKYQECKQYAESVKHSLNEHVKTNTEYRIFRHISIFLMLFSLTLLLASGLYRVYPSETVHFLLTFFALSFLFIVAIWACAITRITQSWPDRKSLKWVIILFIAFCALSFFSLRIHSSWTAEIKESLWMIGLISSVLLPYLNFLFFFLLVTVQMSKIRKHCKMSYSSLGAECEKAGDLMGKILNHQEMRGRIDAHKKEGAKDGGSQGA